MKIKMLTRFGLLAAAGIIAATCIPAASASSVCMNTGNGNGGSIEYYPYLFNNNTFGWSDDKSGSSECLTLNYTNGANGGVYYDGFGSTWNWPDNSNQYDVKAYPSVVYGWQYGYTYSGLGLPTIIYNNKNVPTYQSVSLSGSQNEDVLIDNWLLSSANASKQSDEVEIFVTNDIGAYSNGNLGSITLDNTYYQVSSRTGGAWNVYNFIPNQGSTNLSQSANIKDYVNALCYDYGVISNNLYLGGTQIGVEVYHGNGGVTFNPVAISVN
jgi:hypothetical protein